MKTLLLSSLLCLAACGVGVDSSETGTDDLKAAKPPPGPTYTLRTTDALAASPTFKSSFTIISTNEVDFATDIVGTFTGHHTMTVFINMPGGFAYQRIDLAFAAGVAAAAGEQVATKTSTGYRIWAAIPVAGTMIQTSNIVGQWSAQSWVDSASAANASVSFTLN
jgi:hypothetical protein